MKQLALAGIASVAFLSATAARAEDDDDDRNGEQHAPLAEPIFAETVTDIDGTEAGEFELEANGSVLRAQRNGAWAADTSVELEWLATRELGVRLEPTFSADRMYGATETSVGASCGASWKLVQDFHHDFHADLEALGRVPADERRIAEPGDPAQPFALDVNAGFRASPLTLRWSVGVGAFGDPAHVPLRGALAILFPWERTERLGFWGVEVSADGARRAPFIAALDIVPNIVPAGIPLRLGLALPVTIAARGDEPSLGIFFRIFYESERELAFGRGASR